MHRHNRLSRTSLATMVALATMSCFAEAAGTATPDNPTGTSAPIARHPVAYLVKEKSLIGNEMHEAGTTAMYDGLPAENLEPLCDIGRARYKEYLESNKVRIAKMIEDNKETGHGITDPNAFMAALMKQREDDRKELAETLAAQSAAQAEAIGAAVGNAMAKAFTLFFPNGLPTAAPAAPAAPEAPAATPAAQVASTEQEQSGASGSTGDAGAGTPTKRTK